MELKEVKPVVNEDSLEAVHNGDTWPYLKPLKFEPTPELDPWQNAGNAPESDKEENALVRAHVAGVRVASASSSAASLASVDVPPPALGPASTLKRPKGAKNRWRDPVVVPDAQPVINSPQK